MAQNDEGQPVARPSDPWTDPEVVARFAARPPDHRLTGLLSHGASETRLLDVGCAGGRNTVWAARQGADVHALDASLPMVEETRRRLAEVIGAAEAERRVRHGVMSDLSAYPTSGFDLVVALGVLQDAHDLAELKRTLAEIGRVLRPGGSCLVANFGPESQPGGEPLRPVEGAPHVWLGFGASERRMTLPPAATLDELFAAHGMVPDVPTAIVRVPTELGFRITFNALYRRTGSNQAEQVEQPDPIG